MSKFLILLDIIFATMIIFCSFCLTVDGLWAIETGQYLAASMVALFIFGSFYELYQTFNRLYDILDPQ